MSSPAQILQLYRGILKAAKQFPSVKKFSVIREIKLRFHQDKSETDAKKVAHCLVLAERGLSDLQAYLPKGDGSDNISVTLKGATN